ncbi:hypothetical protein EON80_11380 [bacterium]|nr:MAG: hypothetical protein EON80_11380 [bacterium]
MANHDAVPQTLLEKLKNGDVVPFVGAGVSMAIQSKATGKSLFPSWGQLLRVGIEKLESDGKLDIAKLVQASLEGGDYLLAADWLEKGLQGQLTGIVKQQIGKGRDEIQEDSLELAKRIWELAVLLSSLRTTTVLWNGLLQGQIADPLLIIKRMN